MLEKKNTFKHFLVVEKSAQAGRVPTLYSSKFPFYLLLTTIVWLCYQKGLIYIVYEYALH